MQNRNSLMQASHHNLYFVSIISIAGFSQSSAVSRKELSLTLSVAPAEKGRMVAASSNAVFRRLKLALMDYPLSADRLNF